MSLQTQGEYSREQCINHQMSLQHRRIQQGTMHQPSNGSTTQEEYSNNNASTIKNGSSTQEEYSREQCINHQMGLQWGEYSREQCINHQMGSTQKIQQEQCINHQMGFNTERIQQGTMHQPSNESSTQEEYSREQCINHQMKSSIENTAVTMHQPSNESLQHRKYSRKQCINHQMGLQHRKNTAGNNASTIKWVFNTGRIQQGL
ncbi:unnamed protein product [Mytilus edulis]|uniref:Uncharacterized protein n=1 Tax=Mytilus edulis TaxID=6550 RepID=A0A8S3T0W5_MYTED|nr:unnamed protein product [Mytilus edulis]